MCPHSGFRSGGTCERTLVPVFRSGGTCESTLVPVFRSGGTSAKTTLLETILLGSSENRNRPWDKRVASLGQTGTRPWDNPAVLCLVTQ